MCLTINGQQTVKLQKGTISSNCLFLLKFMLTSESLLKNIEEKKKNTGSYTEKYQDHVPCSFAYKVICIDDKFSKPVVLYREDNAVHKFIQAVLKEHKYCKKVIQKHFNKNLMITQEEEQFQQSNICWICDKLLIWQL